VVADVLGLGRTLSIDGTVTAPQGVPEPDQSEGMGIGQQPVGAVGQQRQRDTQDGTGGKEHGCPPDQDACPEEGDAEEETTDEVREALR
jgi:hypothetical protein